MRAHKGFVIVVVLAVVAVIAAVVAAQLLTAQKTTVVGIRGNEEAQARALAEACLELFTSYAQDAVVDAGPSSDFDRLLNGVNQTSGANPDGDDFIPFNTRPVFIPPAASDAMHRWELVDVVPGSGGLCAVRFDDNSDDGRAPLPGSNTATGCAGTEGTGADVPQCDRDLSVYVTVIGMFPVQAGTPDASAYMKAHARVTLRRLVQKANVAQTSAPALWAGSQVTLHNNNKICGFGGVVADNLQLGSNSCACGDSAGSCTGPGCPVAGQSCAGCTPCSTENPGSTGSQADPPVNIHWGNALGTGYLSSDSLGSMPRADPNLLPPAGPIGQGTTAEPAAGYDLSNGQFCAFFGTNAPNNWDLFVWDRLDPDARKTLEDLADDGVANGSVVAGTNEGTILHGSIPGSDVAPVDGFPDTPVDCRVATTDPMPRPCRWDPTNATKDQRVVCAANESPCWKLVARLKPSGTPGDIVGVDGVTPGWNDGGGNDQFHPVRNFAIPNTARSGALVQVFGTPSPGQVSECGDPATCTACDSSPGVNTAASPVQEESSDHWHFEFGANNLHAPSPGVWILEDEAAPDRDIHLKDSGDATGPFRATLITNGAVLVENNPALCCATCNCSPVAGIISGGGCALNTDFGGAASPFVAPFDTANPGNENYTNPPSSRTVNNLGQAGGVAIKAAGIVSLHNNAFILGDIRAGAVDFHDNTCLVGSAVGYSPTLNLGGTAPCSTVNIEFHDNAHITGDLESMTSIELHDNPKIWGDIIAKTSACFHDNAKIEGTLQAGSEIDLHDGADIINNTTQSGGQFIQANDALQTFMEASW